ncbi:hypothetical protein LCGC14_1924510 [marine sediment metagenome]|uniref:Uncharacterized protein n=1 Tax=marine sediment metagenome TaxID=412755 RepID=A0A0F9I3N9_9ZZZZ
MSAKAQKAARHARELMLAIERDDKGNPVTLEGAIRSMILKSPDFCPYRDDALDTLYCVLGTGIEWSNDGRLYDVSPNNYMNLPPDTYYGVWSDHGRKEALDTLVSGLPDPVSRRITSNMLAREEERLDKHIETIEAIDIRVNLYRPNRSCWYPISWYACRLCVPENVQPDYLAGALETATLVADFDPIRVESGPGALDLRMALRTRQFAKDILPVLKERWDCLKEETDDPN